MELRHLRYFVTVAEELNFTRAAELLGLGQPSLSQQIHQLEQEIGSPLFHRLARGVELTNVGEALRKDARVLLADLERAKATAQRVARGEEGVLRIGFTMSTCCNPLIATVIRNYGMRFPGVAVSLELGFSTALAEAVREGRVDAAFVRTPFAEREGLTVYPLLNEELVIALPSGHPLSRLEAVPLAVLADENFVFFPRRSTPGLYDATIAACRGAGFIPRVIQEVEFPPLLSLVAAGLGVSIVPISMRYMHTPAVVYRSVEDGIQAAQVSLIQRSNEGSAAVRSLASMARLAAHDEQEAAAPPTGAGLGQSATVSQPSF